MVKQEQNVFLTVDDVHSFTDVDGMRYEYPVVDTTNLGFLSDAELQEYANLIRHTDFTSGGYCMRYINALKNLKNNTLNLKIYPDIHSNKCGCVRYPSQCPLAISRGECKHPLVIELIGKKFYPGMYSKEQQK